MKTDKLIWVYDPTWEPLNGICNYLDEGYVLISTNYSDTEQAVVYHLRKTPFTWLMTKISKLI